MERIWILYVRTRNNGGTLSSMLTWSPGRDLEPVAVLFLIWQNPLCGNPAGFLRGHWLKSDWTLLIGCRQHKQSQARNLPFLRSSGFLLARPVSISHPPTIDLFTPPTFSISSTDPRCRPAPPPASPLAKPPFWFRTSILNLILFPSKLSPNQPKTLLNIIVQFTMRQFDQHFFSSPLRFPTYNRVIMCFRIGLTTPSLARPINCSQWLPVPRCAAPAACHNPEQSLSLANPIAANNISVTSVYA